MFGFVDFLFEGRNRYLTFLLYAKKRLFPMPPNANDVKRVATIKLRVKGG